MTIKGEKYLKEQYNKVAWILVFVKLRFDTIGTKEEGKEINIRYPPPTT